MVLRAGCRLSARARRSAGTAAGSAATLAVAVHEIPQELGDFMVLRAAGFSTVRQLHLLDMTHKYSYTC